MDSTVPDIQFDDNGICNYCKLHDLLDKEFPRGEVGEKKIEKLFEDIKRKGKNKEYDCIIGVSGGTDSTYLLHIAKKHGLKPLAVHLDSGWDSEIAVQNIKNSVAKLGVDLETYVIDWEEIKDILVAFLKASVPWADGPTDVAIQAVLYKIAAREKISYVMVGADFRTEGKQPIEWTYCDGRFIKSIYNKYGNYSIKTFPNMTLWKFVYYGFIRNIKLVRPLYHLEYNKGEAQKILEQEYGWTYYGGHHHESIYTRFAIGYLLREKFNIDKRKVTFSALIRSGEMTREDAVDEIKQLPYQKEKIIDDVDYVIKKLGLTQQEFEEILDSPPKKFTDYPSYYHFVNNFRPIINFAIKFILPWRPPTLYKMES